jgi:predicted outer membrane repeat protein
MGLENRGRQRRAPRWSSGLWVEPDSRGPGFDPSALHILLDCAQYVILLPLGAKARWREEGATKTAITARAQLVIGLATLALAALAGPPAALAAGVVTTCDETHLDTALSGGGLVTFNCGAATITVTITKDISAATTIDGGGLITLSGGNSVGVFSVEPGVNFTVQNLTVANGSGFFGGIINNGGTLTVTNSTFSGNSAGAYGGGIYNNGGTLTVTNSTFSGNSAPGGYGGGIANYAGTVTATNSTFSGNSAGASGGGIYNNGGSVTITNSTFSGNSAPNAANGGGGIDNYAGTVTITNSTFSGNSAGAYGGGIYNAEGLLTITNSTFSGNSAGDGGAIDSAGTMTVTNSTFSGNSASLYGGGIYHYSGTATVINTILANSTSGGNCSGLITLITDGGHNIDDGTTCGFTGTGCTTTTGTSFCNTNPDLAAALANNGGPTQTIALLAGSPAVDHGDPSVCAAPPVNNVDQRGVTRSTASDPICDIGAFELTAPEPTAPVHQAPALSASWLFTLAALLGTMGWLRARRRARA